MTPTERHSSLMLARNDGCRILIRACLFGEQGYTQASQSMSYDGGLRQPTVKSRFKALYRMQIVEAETALFQRFVPMMDRSFRGSSRMEGRQSRSTYH